MKLRHIIHTALCWVLGAGIPTANAQGVHVGARADSLKELLTQPQTTDRQIFLLNALANTLMRKDVDEALVYAKKALVLAKQEHNTVGILKAKNIIGSALTKKGNFTEALDICFESLNEARQAHLPYYEARALSCLANIYTPLHEYDSALLYNRNALALYRAMDSTSQMLKVLNNMGTVFSKDNQNDSALAYYQQIQSLEKQLNLPPSSLVVGNIGGVYMLLGQYEKAQQLLRQALSENDAAGIKTYQSGLYSDIGNCFFRTGRLDSAYWYTTKALRIAKESNIIANQYEIYTLLAKILHAQGKDRAAYEMTLSAQSIADSTRGDEVMQAIARAEVRSYLQHKEWENSLLRKQHDADEDSIRSNQIILTISIIAFILGGLLAFTWFRLIREKHNSLIAQRNAQLTEYTRLNSHILRARVATMLGLLSLFKTENLSPDEGMYYQKLTETANDLDHVIHEINATLLQDE